MDDEALVSTSFNPFHLFFSRHHTLILSSSSTLNLNTEPHRVLLVVDRRRLGLRLTPDFMLHERLDMCRPTVPHGVCVCVCDRWEISLWSMTLYGSMCADVKCLNLNMAVLISCMCVESILDYGMSTTNNMYLVVVSNTSNSKTTQLV